MTAPTQHIHVGTGDVVVFDADCIDTGDEDYWRAAMEHLREAFPKNVILLVPGGRALTDVMTREQAQEALRAIAESDV